MIIREYRDAYRGASQMIRSWVYLLKRILLCDTSIQQRSGAFGIIFPWKLLAEFFDLLR